MNYRLNSPLMILLGVIIVGAIGLFGYTVYTSKIAHQSEEATTTPSTDDIAQMTSEIITAKHQFKNGMHIVAGELSVPTPCHTVTADPFFMDDSTSGNVEIRFTITQPDPQAICAQVVTPRTFYVTFSGPEKVNISAQVNGKPVRLNLVEVPPGEKIGSTTDEFFKG